MRRVGPLFGTTVALVLAFVWGGLAYRELGPKTARSLAASVPGLTAVRGTEAPPGWIGDFATAFCGGDAQGMAARIGPPLTGNVDAIAQALTDREWTCTDMRFIGAGNNKKGAFYVYVMRDKQAQEQWWVFTVVAEQVVAIE